ncbi:MAG: DUF6705 family protein [Rikenellaceae bacterium]|jgi:hypothetical protein
MKTVKFILILVLYFGISHKVQGQNIPNYDFYIGTWIYETANEKFTLKTKSYNYYFLGKTHYVVLGTFRYEKNGSVIFDNLNSLVTTIMDDGNPKVVLVNEADLPSNQTHQSLRFRLTDPITRYLSGYSQVHIISTNPARISWTLNFDEGVYSENEIIGFSIPMNMILTKVNQ